MYQHQRDQTRLFQYNKFMVIGCNLCISSDQCIAPIVYNTACLCFAPGNGRPSKPIIMSVVDSKRPTVLDNICLLDLMFVPSDYNNMWKIITN